VLVEFSATRHRRAMGIAQRHCLPADCADSSLQQDCSQGTVTR
jgi:hypothetical protein